MDKIACAEIWKILEQLTENDKNKIPKEILEIIESSRDKEYRANINLNIPLQQQQMSEKAVEILCYLEMEYLSTPEQREELISVYKQNEERISEELDINKVFDKRKKEVLPVEIKQAEKWYTKIWNKIRSFFIDKKLIKRKW